MVIYPEQDAHCLHMVWLMPQPSQTPIVSCLIKIQSAFTFLVLAFPGRLGKEAIKPVFFCFYLDFHVSIYVIHD